MDVTEVLRRGEEEALAGLKQFVSFPSVSSQPDHRADTRACAQWLASQLEATGLEHVGLWETGSYGSGSSGQPDAKIP